MSGAVIQLVNKGAQDQLVCGNPSFTHFRSVYKRHTDFAMEHFELVFKTTNLQLPKSGSLTLRAKVEQFAQLLHDCYIVMTLPDIYSSIAPLMVGHTNLNLNSRAIGYEFQWARNIGYNMINYVAISINGQEVVRHTGEWMKLYADMNFDANKKAMVNQMVGNLPEMYDPANAYDRMNQYPHAISSCNLPSEPSIRGMTLNVPLHFWFCENVGAALPLVSLQYSTVEIVVELKNMYQLFTVRDVREYINGAPNANFGNRIAPDSSDTHFTMNNFLSPATYGMYPKPSNPTLMQWNLNPFIEANYIFLSDPELVHLAKTEQTFIINQIDTVNAEGQYGPSNDLTLLMKNLCTQVVWVAQRSDRVQLNDYDNYTNWEDPYKPPLDTFGLLGVTPAFSSGISLQTSVSQKDILLESAIILDGKERFSYKGTYFFSQLQSYRHQSGRTSTDIPGVYSYSFALDHHTGQPSGHINGSMFNKTILRNSYVQPPLTVQCAPCPVLCAVVSDDQTLGGLPQIYAGGSAATTEVDAVIDGSTAVSICDVPGAPCGIECSTTCPPNTIITPTTTTLCVLKSTASLPNPTVIDPTTRDATGKLVYSPNEVVTIVISSSPSTKTLQYTFTVRAFVESYNYLRIMGGIGNVIFSS